MKTAPDLPNERKHTLPRLRARLIGFRRSTLAALRQAETMLWHASGGDSLSRRSASGRLAPGPSGPLVRPVLLAFLTALAVAVLAGCSDSVAQSAAAPPPPVEVPVRRVAERVVPVEFEFTGQSAASHHVDVRARVGGYVVNVPYVEGEFVEAGTLLFEIDARPYVAVQARAEAEVTRARAAVKLAGQELERAERLAAMDAIAVEELERRRGDREMAGASLASALAQRDAAALDVEFTKVKAPVSGRVSRSLVRPGNLISGGDAGGTLLTTLVATAPLHVLFNIDEAAYQRLTDLVGTGATLRAAARLGQAGWAVDGKLDYLAPAIDVRSGAAQARLVVPNPDGRFVPGLFARVAVQADTRQSRVLVPETAIGAHQGTRFVLVVDRDNRVTHRTVVVGERHGGDRVVASGLQPGESIVVNGLQRVRPGMTVQPVEASLAVN